MINFEALIISQLTIGLDTRRAMKSLRVSNTHSIGLIVVGVFDGFELIKLIACSVGELHNTRRREKSFEHLSWCNGDSSPLHFRGMP